MKRWLMGCVVLAMVASVQASVYTVSPTVAGRTVAGGTGTYDGNVIVGIWYAPESTSWLKFNIPEYQGENITQVSLNVNIDMQYNPTYTAGVSVYYVPDDSWTTSNITSSWAVDGASVVYNRSASDSGANGTGLITSDITSYLTKSGEGEGATLSICLTRTGGGDRGAFMSVPSLTIMTETVPEPTSIAFLMVSMVAGLWSRKNK
jgi:hypothetical protein